MTKIQSMTGSRPALSPRTVMSEPGPLRHATSDALDLVEPLLEHLRSRPGLVERPQSGAGLDVLAGDGQEGHERHDHDR